MEIYGVGLSLVSLLFLSQICEAFHLQNRADVREAVCRSARPCCPGHVCRAYQQFSESTPTAACARTISSQALYLPGAELQQRYCSDSTQGSSSQATDSNVVLTPIAIDGAGTGGTTHQTEQQHAARTSGSLIPVQAGSVESETQQGSASSINTIRLSLNSLVPVIGDLTVSGLTVADQTLAERPQLSATERSVQGGDAGTMRRFLMQENAPPLAAATREGFPRAAATHIRPPQEAVSRFRLARDRRVPVRSSFGRFSAMRSVPRDLSRRTSRLTGPFRDTRQSGTIMGAGGRSVRTPSGIRWAGTVEARRQSQSIGAQETISPDTDILSWLETVSSRRFV